MDTGLFRQLLLRQARCLAGNADGMTNRSDAPNVGAPFPASFCDRRATGFAAVERSAQNPKSKMSVCAAT
jgi:hypothetical protein